ncbi:MAG: hypothetical protein R3D29_15195 [Nitratireductor sp.]
MIEQDEQTRHYSIGPAVLPLARVREINRPLLSILEPVVQRISRRLDETAHFCVPAQNGVAVACIAESTKSMRVHLKVGHILPMTTSGAGIAFLSASTDAFVKRFTSSKAPQFTEFSLVAHQVPFSTESMRQGHLDMQTHLRTFEMGDVRTCRSGL